MKTDRGLVGNHVITMLPVWAMLSSRFLCNLLAECVLGREGEEEERSVRAARSWASVSISMPKAAGIASP